MQRIKAFIHFWQDFIIGGDWTIANTVVWSLAVVFVLVRSSINAWFVLPIIIAASIAWSSWQALAAKTGARNQPAIQNYFSIFRAVPLWLPMASVVILPLVIFRLQNNDLSLAHFLLPVSFNILVVTIVAASLTYFYNRRPFATSLIAVFISVWAIDDRLQSKIQILSERINEMAPGVRYSVAVLMIIVTVAALVAAFSHKMDGPDPATPGLSGNH